MNTAVAIDQHASNEACHCAAEKIGLRRIRLSMSRQRLSAIVGSFFAADKVLQGWALRQPGLLECEFEIVYDDGRTITGDFSFPRRPAGRPALMPFVRKTVIALCEGKSKASPVRGLVEGAHSFLAQYETDDFISN